MIIKPLTSVGSLQLQLQVNKFERVCEACPGFVEGGRKTNLYFAYMYYCTCTNFLLSPNLQTKTPNLKIQFSNVSKRVYVRRNFL